MVVEVTPMTGTRSMESTAGVRRFTIFAWLLWTLIPALAVAAFGYVTDSATRSAGNADPASVMAGISAGFLMIVLLVPVVTTLQWLVLRRAWPRLVWPAWLLVVFVSILATLVAGPIVAMRTHSWLYGEIPPVLTIALAAAAVLAVASPKPLLRSVFAVLFVAFLGGGVLMCGINTPVIGRLLLESSYQHQMLSFMFYHRDLISLASGTAVSGFGLWLVSRWASKKDVGRISQS